MKTELTLLKFCLNLKETNSACQASSLWESEYFSTHARLCYTSAWLHAKFLKGCKLSESFQVQGLRGVFSHRFILPSIPASLWGPTAELKQLWLGWFSQVLLFVLENLLWLQLSVQHSSRCGTEGFYTVRGCTKYHNAALLYLLQGWVVFPGVGFSTAKVCAAIPGLKRLVFFVQRQHKN